MAEIELVLIVTVLMTLLFVGVGVLRIGLARLDTAHGAWFQAYRNATAEQTPTAIDDPEAVPVEGYIQIRPGMPNRVIAPRPTSEVTVLTADSSRPSFQATLGGAAAMPAPPWIYSAYPATSEQANNQEWFQTWIDESHGAYGQSLGLAPAWTP